MRLLTKSNKQLVGVDITATSVKMVEIIRQQGLFHLKAYGMAPLQIGDVADKNIADPEAVGETIRSIHSSQGFSSKQAATAVSGTTVISKIIDMDAVMSDTERESQIRLDADQYIPYSLSEVNLDFAILGRSLVQANCNKVLLVISRSEHIEQHSDALVFAGLKPSVIDTEPEARQRAFQFLSSHNTDFLGTTAWVDIGQTRLTIYIAVKGEFVYHLEQLFGDSHLVRAIATHYNLSAADAEQAKLDLQLLGSECLMDYDLVIFQPFIQSLVDYIKVAFEQYIAISPDKEVEQIILSGDAAGLPQLDKSLQHQMGLPVTLANPFLSMPLSHSIDAEQLFKDAPQLMTACGLAMRSHTMTQIY